MSRLVGSIKSMWIGRAPGFWGALTMMVASVFGVVLLCSGISTAQTAPLPANTTYTIKDLGTLGGSYSYATGINDAGQVVGWSFTTTGQRHAFLYSGGQMQDLGTLGGTDSQAYGVNDAGQVVGQTNVSSGQRHAFLYSDGQMQDLGTLGGTESEARGINDAGQVVGWSFTTTGQRHAFLYSGGQMQDLGTLPGDNRSEARGINASGQVVGYSDVGRDDRAHAFLYSDGQMQDLSKVEGTGTAANDINDSGQIVGWLDGDSAWVYSDGQMQDLSELIPPDSGWLPEAAMAINTSGQIAGVGDFYENGRGLQRAFLATPNQAPRVTSTSPTANATAVDPATNVTATFSEEMMASSINPQTFELFTTKGSKKGVAASVRYDAATHTATLVPTHSLQKGVSYNAVVTTGAKDLDGNPLEQEHGWSFTVRK